MSSLEIQASRKKVTAILAAVLQKGAVLWCENDQLRYRVCKGMLTAEELGQLRGAKDEILALVGANDHELSKFLKKCDDGCRRAPCAFSQRAHWHLHQLEAHRAVRAVASATRLRGAIDVSALEGSIEKIVNRHDALRTRIISISGVPVQEVTRSCNCNLEVDDLTGMPESLREQVAKRTIEDQILEPIDVSVGPLFGPRLIRLKENEWILILVLEHIVADGFSLGLLLRDIFGYYVSAVSHQQESLPTISMQFPDYAVWQQSTFASRMQKHGLDWAEKLLSSSRLRFPLDRSAMPHSGWGVLPIQFGGALKAELTEWCRAQRTTVVMAIFSAYAAAVLRWCGVAETLIQYQYSGREDSRIESAVGYFASILPVRVKLKEHDNFLHVLEDVTEEYCRAHDHADHSYLAAQLPRPGFTGNTTFNWIPWGSGFNMPSLDAITFMPVRFVTPMLRSLELDQEPTIQLRESPDDVIGRIYFSQNRFSTQYINRFGRSFMGFVEAMLRDPLGRVNDVQIYE